VTDAPGSNWAGTHDYAARGILTPGSAQEIADAVRAGGRLKALGSRHSFNDIADSSGRLVSLERLAGEPTIDAARQRVAVPAGLRFADLAVWLEAQGLALHNLGSLPHISVAGAVSTGTHGSGRRNGNLSSAVSGVQFVSGTGDLLTVERGDADFDGVVVSLGALGIVTEVTLDVQPSYQVRQDIYLDLPWDAVLGEFDAIMSSAYSVSLFTDWTGESLKQAWVKSRVDARPQLPPSFFGAHPAGGAVMSPAGDDLDNTTVQGGVPGPWFERLPHFRADVTPSAGDEIQTEYFVDLTVAVDAIRAVRALADRIAPTLLVTELRTIAADRLWLSPAVARDSLAIHFTWFNRPAEVRAVLPLIEQALAPFEPRPHWGKWFSLGAEQIAPRYERFDDFRALAERLDPHHRFRNDYLERVLGLPS